MNQPCATKLKLAEYQAQYDADMEREYALEKIREEVDQDLMVGRRCEYMGHVWTLATVNIKLFNSDAFDRYIDWRGTTDDPRTLQRLEEAINRKWERLYFEMREEIALMILEGGR